MATLKNIFDKCGVALYQNESLDLDHYYQEPYQDEGDEIKAIGKPFETNDSNKIRKYDLFAEDRTFSNFSFFMDGSRRTYKIGDIVIDGGKKIYPVVIAQIRAGCTERDGAKKLHSHQTILRKNLLLLSESIKDDVAIIVMNVKGDDLLHVHQPNEKITDAQRKDWDDLGVPCTPFENVKYLYPYRQQKDKLYANTALPVEDLAEQFNGGQAANFIYTFEHDISKVDMLFSNVDDPNYTIESILNYIDYGSEFKGDLSWANFKEVLKEFCSKGSDKKDKSSILIQSWQRFRRLINNSINDDIFVNAKSSKKEQHQVYLSDEIMNINGGEMKVVDIAGLTEQLQCLVFGDIIRSVYSLKHGDFEDERTSKKPIPKRIIIFVDELNKYAPSTSSKNSPLLANLLDITERGRSEGVILFSAEQFRSAIHDRIKGNCGTNIYGRTNAIEVSRPDYKFVPSVYANMMTRLRKGDLIVHHPVFKTLLKIQFPFPSYNQGGSK